MVFYSISFFIFFLLVILLYFFQESQQNRIKILAFSNIIFYALYSIPFALFLLTIISVNFFFGKRISESDNDRTRRILFYCSVFLSIAILFFFKYFIFSIQTLGSALSLLQIPFNPSAFSIKIIAPLGLSFYTFQNISYIIDIKRAKIKAERHYLNYLAYSTLFLTISSGPIVRAGTFLPQLKKKRSFIWSNFYRGFLLVTFGMFLKIVVADNLSIYIDRVFNPVIPATTVLNKWAGLYAYTIQIYTDFAGYSNMAIGFALILGFIIPENFNSPYSSVSFVDFWRRWHISLSTWIRDYLFLPLSYKISRLLKENRYFNIKTEYLIYSVASIISMTLCGLWHGAEMHFIFWGFLFGVFLSIERALRTYKKPKNKLFLFLQKLIIFHLICFLWVIFKLEFPQALHFYQGMFVHLPEAHDVLTTLPILILLCVLIMTLLIQNISFDYFYRQLFNRKKSSAYLYVISVALMWISILILNGKSSPFVYTQF